MKQSPKNSRLSAETLSQVTDEHVHQAVRMLLKGYSIHQFAASIDYDLITSENKRLPPKAVFGVAATLALGFEVLPKHFTAGENSICFRTLRKAGYVIAAKDNWVPLPLQDLSLEERQRSEGKKRLVMHIRRERASGLAEYKKQLFKQQHGKLYCESCGLDPVEKYSTADAECCIEVHHDQHAVADMAEGHLTMPEDLRCLCANCHRLVHKQLREAEKTVGRIESR